MGFIKKTMFYGFGVPVRPTSRKERLYRHQMGYDDLSIGNFVHNVFGTGDKTSNQSSDNSNINALQNTSQGRIACPTCAELIMPAAVKCRFCNEATNFPQQVSTEIKSVSAPTQIAPNQTPAFAAVQKLSEKLGGRLEKIADKMDGSNTEKTLCPSCKRAILEGATKCRYCKTVIAEYDEIHE
jgi:hypothetical protein